MFKATSKNKIIIRLSEERWLHIVESHDEMAGYLEDVLETIENPELIIRGKKDELLGAKYYEDVMRYLIAVYKEGQRDGFVVTAFFTSKIEKMKKRGVVWQQK